MHGASSQDTRIPEGIVAPPGRIGSDGSDYYMVEQLDVESLGRPPELPSHLHIGRAWCRVARWVVVDTGDGGCSMLDRAAEHLAWMCSCEDRAFQAG